MSESGYSVLKFLVWIIPTLFAIVFHELSHGAIAYLLGDDTAKRAGRLSVNPLKHIDFFGTLIMPVTLAALGLPVFGYAKPVPVSFEKLKPPRMGSIMVAAVGPLTNILLALFSARVLRELRWGVPSYLRPWSIWLLEASIIINVTLAVFNLIPLPPLDGGRILVGLLPERWGELFTRVERYGMLILLLLLSNSNFQNSLNSAVVALTRLMF